MKYQILTFPKSDEKILSVCNYQSKIYYCGTSKQLKDVDDKIYHAFKKSARTVTRNGNFLGCGSYDCTAVIFKDGELFDTIEGPETEIKSIALNDENTFVAIATRGKTVWICKIGKNIEIDAVIDDHYHDVKGVKFNNGLLYSYGYDNRILIYERLEIDESWEMIHTIELENTVWSVDFTNDSILCSDHDGNIYIYKNKLDWKLEKKLKVSMFPVYSVAYIFDSNIAFVLNLSYIGILDKNFDFLEFIDCGGNINSFYYDKNKNEIVVAMDKKIKVISFQEN